MNNSNLINVYSLLVELITTSQAQLEFAKKDLDIINKRTELNKCEFIHPFMKHSLEMSIKFMSQNLNQCMEIEKILEKEENNHEL